MNSKLTFTLLIAVSLTARASGPGSPQEVRYQKTVNDTGHVFYDGEWVKPPYVVESTVNTVTINGHVVQQFASRSTQTRSSGQPVFSQPRQPRQNNPMRRGAPRRRGPARLLHTGDRNQRVEFDPEHGMQYEDEHGEEGRERSIENAELTAMEIGEVLRNGGAIVAFTDVNAVILSDGQLVSQFAKTISTPDDQAAAQEFVNSCPQESRAKVREWLTSFQPSQELLVAMESKVAFYDKLEADALFRMKAVRWLENLNYPLTMVGMLLGVVAFGHTLKWAATMVSQQGAIANVACTERAIMLIGGMSVLDLIWTMAAYYAGAMREINPVAALMISSPGQLVAFKLMATGLGASILYSWRNRTQIQQATWWMCLVCVLLTFRWVVFDSVMN